MLIIQRYVSTLWSMRKFRYQVANVPYNMVEEQVAVGELTELIDEKNPQANEVINVWCVKLLSNS